MDVLTAAEDEEDAGAVAAAAEALLPGGLTGRCLPAGLARSEPALTKVLQRSGNAKFVKRCAGSQGIGCSQCGV